MIGTEHEALRDAVARSLRAPSEHNAQPWRWVLGTDHLDLYVEHGRRLRFTDERGHGVLLGCGCALHHLAAVASRVLAAVALASGDPLGDIEAWPGAIAEFRATCRRFGWA